MNVLVTRGPCLLSVRDSTGDNLVCMRACTRVCMSVCMPACVSTRIYVSI